MSGAANLGDEAMLPPNPIPVVVHGLGPVRYAGADEQPVRVLPGGPMSLRWVLVHVVEEYARHNGHADLLRERIDGRVGQ